MKSLLKIFALVIILPCSAAIGQINENEFSRFEVDFENSPVGAYLAEQLEKDWEHIKWSGGLERAEIVETNNSGDGRALNIYYPKGALGPKEGGAQFVRQLNPQNKYTLSYDFQVSEDFDFRLGGKLPGLTSGGSKYTGGNKPDKGQGWSARFMWRAEGEMVLYLYHVGMKGKWGDDHSLQMPHLERGKWYSVKQCITLNSSEMKNGEITVWVDGKKVLNLKDLELRKGQLGQIDSFYFSTFFGGNTDNFRPLNDCSILFDNFKVTHK